ncbi:MAG TPA: hypothetical protein VFH51_02955 [Myxococcota bacterium]|nr:hypothetical protein [Myxococcota bacterium]
MKLKSCSTPILSVLASGLLVACGGAAALDADVPTAQSAAMSEVGENAQVSIRIIEGEFSEAGNTAECLTLRGKIFGLRQKLKLSSEWRTLTGTAEYQAYESDKEHFAGAGCHKPSTTPAAACQELQGKLNADADAVGNLSAWSQLESSHQFNDLMTAYQKAVAINCVSQ